MKLKFFAALILLCCAACAWAQSDSLSHSFSVGASLRTRGELRYGALPSENGEAMATFISGRTLLDLGYKHKGLEIRIIPKHSGVWGAMGNGAFSLDEAWLDWRGKSGLFVKLGRQKLRYDDQRIIGDNDWTMAAGSHDVLKFGFENDHHKAHAILAFNQNNENINGGTYYVGGGQPYKAMETLWYNFSPLKQLRFSLLFMNIGMQNLMDDTFHTEQQQLFGAYGKWSPKSFSLEASYYRQTGRDEYALPINAWMTSAEASWQISQAWKVYGGYFHMSGDEHFFVPPAGAIGMARKTEVRGFNPIFGSHHQFYGAMDFFYVTTYYGGNTPGLQDGHIGAGWQPAKSLNFDLSYHFLATSVEVQNASMALGHEVEFVASWNITPNANLMAGYSFMHGTDTMEVLKRSNENNRLHWAWIMFTVTPKFFSTRW